MNIAATMLVLGMLDDDHCVSCGDSIGYSSGDLCENCHENPFDEYDCDY